MMEMLSTTDGGGVTGLQQSVSTTAATTAANEKLNGGGEGWRRDDEVGTRRSPTLEESRPKSARGAHFESDAVWWSGQQRQWSHGRLTLDKKTLKCSTTDGVGGSGEQSTKKMTQPLTTSIWKILLTSDCEVVRVPAPTSLEDLADDSSDEDGSLPGPPGVSSTLYCLRVSKYRDEAFDETTLAPSEDDEASSSHTFERIIGCRTELEVSEWQMNIQSAVDSAMENELDRLMIFAADGDGGRQPKSVLSTIASKTKSILSRGREQMRGRSVSTQRLFFIFLFFSSFEPCPHSLFFLLVSFFSCFVLFHVPSVLSLSLIQPLLNDQTSE
jgi:hypothetical protein